MMLNQEKYNKNFPIIIGGLTEDQERVHNYSKNIKEYILSSGETHTVREFIEKSFNLINIDGVWTGNELEETFIYNNKTLVKINPILYRPAEVDLLLGDSTKARKNLNWLPEFSFENLVKEMVDNDLKNV
jgi:GDPmannose 4,6-dehydratase